ncbi:MAG: putative sulfate exporter family transporter [Halopseudomonas sp.]
MINQIGIKSQYQLQHHFPGVLACVTVGLAAGFLSDHYGGPTMLYALLLGIAFNFLHQNERTQAGIELSVKSILRIGVALLGFRMSIDAVIALGWPPILLVVGSVIATIVFGACCARFVQRDSRFGLLTGGAVAICGASAALAISALSPKTPEHERDTLFTVIAVTAMITIAMVIYPIFAAAIGLSETASGIFFGATIHDVAQVVGAGYSVSAESGDTATVIKLIRVAMLLPVVLTLSLLMRQQQSMTNPTGAALPIPWFVFAFALFVALNSSGWLAPTLTESLVEISRICIVTAVAGLGMKTSLGELVKIGPKPVLLIVAETLFLAGLITLALQFL